MRKLLRIAALFSIVSAATLGIWFIARASDPGEGTYYLKIDPVEVEVKVGDTVKFTSYTTLCLSTTITFKKWDGMTGVSATSGNPATLTGTAATPGDYVIRAETTGGAWQTSLLKIRDSLLITNKSGVTKTVNDRTATKVGTKLVYTAKTQSGTLTPITLAVTNPDGQVIAQNEGDQPEVEFTAESKGTYTLKATSSFAYDATLEVDALTSQPGDIPAVRDGDELMTVASLGSMYHDADHGTEWFVAPGVVSESGFERGELVDTDLDWDGTTVYDTFDLSGAIAWTTTAGEFSNFTAFQKTGYWKPPAECPDSPVMIAVNVVDDGTCYRDAATSSYTVATLAINVFALTAVSFSDVTSPTSWAPGTTAKVKVDYETTGLLPKVKYTLMKQGTDHNYHQVGDEAIESYAEAHTFDIPDSGWYQVKASDLSGRTVVLTSEVFFKDDFEVTVTPSPLVFDFNPGVVAGKPETMFRDYLTILNALVNLAGEITHAKHQMHAIEGELHNIHNLIQRDIAASGGGLSARERIIKAIGWYTVLSSYRKTIDLIRRMQRDIGKNFDDATAMRLVLEARPESITKKLAISVNQSGTFPCTLAVDDSQTTWKTTSQGNLSFAPASVNVTGHAAVDVVALGNLGKGKLKVQINGRTKYVDFDVKGLTKQEALDTLAYAKQQIESKKDDLFRLLLELGGLFTAIASALGLIGLALTTLLGPVGVIPGAIVGAFALAASTAAAFVTGLTVLVWSGTKLARWLVSTDDADTIRRTYPE